MARLKMKKVKKIHVGCIGLLHVSAMHADVNNILEKNNLYTEIPGLGNTQSRDLGVENVAGIHSVFEWYSFVLLLLLLYNNTRQKCICSAVVIDDTPF